MTHDEIMNMTDEQLDCAVAVAHGWHEGQGVVDGLVWFDGHQWIKKYHPSRDGNQLLEIMNREKISVNFEFDGCWSADNFNVDEMVNESTALGSSIGRAVLRCYLLSKQGGNNG